MTPLTGQNSCTVRVISPPVGSADSLQGHNWVVLFITITWKVNYERLRVYCWFYWFLKEPITSPTGSNNGQPQHSQSRVHLEDEKWNWDCGQSRGGFKPFNWAQWTEICRAYYQQHVHFSELQLKIRSTEVIFSWNLHVSAVISVC